MLNLTARRFVSLLSALAMGVGLLAVTSSSVSAAVALPGGKPNYVVSVIGGGLDQHHVRIAQYTFTAGSGSTGTVHETFWYWHQYNFTGGASTNKVQTGYSSRGTGCNNCPIRAPKGFQPGSNGKTLTGTYYKDTNGRIVITWTGGQRETWSVSTAVGYVKLTLFNSNFNLRKGEAYGSTASFSKAASRDDIKNLTLYQTLRSASNCPSGKCPTASNGYMTEKVRVPLYFGSGPSPYVPCSGSPCLSLINSSWRSIFVVPTGQGRRSYWQSQNHGVDNYYGVCFSTGGGHTWALLQIIDDNGKFIGFVGAEASLASKYADANAVVSQMTLVSGW